MVLNYVSFLVAAGFARAGKLIHQERWSLFVKMRDTPPTHEEHARAVELLEMSQAQASLILKAATLRTLAGIEGQFSKREYLLARSRADNRGLTWDHVKALPEFGRATSVIRHTKRGTGAPGIYTVTDPGYLIAAAENLEAGEAFRLAMADALKGPKRVADFVIPGTAAAPVAVTGVRYKPAQKRHQYAPKAKPDPSLLPYAMPARRISPFEFGTYKPDTTPPARLGALDFKHCPSLGATR